MSHRRFACRLGRVARDESPPCATTTMSHDYDHPRDPTDNSPRPTRIERRAEAEAYASLAEQLARSRAGEFPDPPFTRLLRDEVMSARRLAKGARPRQIRRLAQLLAQEGPVSAFREALDKDSPTHRATRAREHIVEAWRTRLVGEGDTALSEFVVEHPTADRQHLRQLLRQAQRSPPDARSKRAATTLLREIRLFAVASDAAAHED